MKQSQPRVSQLLKAALAAVILISATVSVAHADPFDDLLAQAQNAKKAGDLTKTAALLRQAIAIKPVPALLNNLGRILEQMGDYQGAVDSYQKVANDPKADANIRSLDAARIATLQNKLSKGWVLATISPAGSNVLVEGRPPAAPPGKEFPVEPGATSLEFSSPDGTVVALLKRSFPLGKRTSLAVSFAPGPLDKGWGSVIAWGMAPKPKTIRVDGYLLRARGVTELRLPVGAHKFAVELVDGRSVVLSLVVKTGEPTALAPAMKAALANLRKTMPDPEPVAESFNPGPYVLIGVGAIAAGIGGFLVADAAANRDDVTDATRDSRGVITSITLAEAEEAEEGADINSSIGVAVIGLGGAMLVGGIIWAVLDSTSSSETKSDVNVSVGPTSLGLGGRVSLGGRF